MSAMPLQNRVDPFGAIHAVPARGLFTGNRGVIHDPDTRTLLRRRWATKAWIICECDFRGQRREVMGRNAPGGRPGWTELFFLDEVTALAAGHRPCFYCRRDSALAFASCLAGGEGPRTPAPQMDARLHAERRASGGAVLPLEPAQLADLPDGTMVEQNGLAYALRGGRLLPWDFSGYGPPRKISDMSTAVFTLITPPSTVARFARGYRPVWHPSAY